MHQLPAFANMTMSVRRELCAVMVFAVVERAGTIVLNDGEEVSQTLIRTRSLSAFIWNLHFILHQRQCFSQKFNHPKFLFKITFPLNLRPVLLCTLVATSIPWLYLHVAQSLASFSSANQAFSFRSVKPEWTPAFSILRLQDARGAAGIAYLLISILTCQKEPFSPLMHPNNWKQGRARGSCTSQRRHCYQYPKQLKYTSSV